MEVLVPLASRSIVCSSERGLGKAPSAETNWKLSSIFAESPSCSASHHARTTNDCWSSTLPTSRLFFYVLDKLTISFLVNDCIS